MPFSVQLQDHTLLFTPTYFVLVPCVALVLTWLVSILSASRPVIELPRVRTRCQGLQKIQAARANDFAPFLALSPISEKEFLAPSMARSTAEAFNMVCCPDRDGKLDDSPQD